MGCPGSSGYFSQSHARYGAARFFDLADDLFPRRPGCLRALEVGSGSGALLLRLKLAGYDVEGVENDPTAAKVAAEMVRCPIHIGDFAKLNLGEKRFDLVVMSHVFEHCADSRRVLAQIHRILNDPGIAVIIYPNPQSLGAWWFGPMWFGWEVPRHLVMPPIEAMRNAAAREGLRMLNVRTQTADAARMFALSRGIASFTDWEEATPRMIDHALARVESALMFFGFKVGEEVVCHLARAY